MRIGVLGVVLVLLAQPVRGDTVILTSGMTVEGVVTVRGDKIEVKVPEGLFTYRKDIVKEIRKGVSPVERYEQQAKAIGVGDVKAHMALAESCKAKGMRLQAAEQYRAVIGIEPDNPDAREALGQQNVNGRWLSESDAMTARGMVRVDGRWLTRDAADSFRRLQQSQAATQASQARYHAEVRQIHANYNASISELDAGVAARESQRAQEAAAAAEKQRQQELYGRYQRCGKCSARVPDGENFCPKCNNWMRH